ncbi:MAG TPA: glycosyltransferase [Thermoanaerobaculia bacterium]
MSRPAVSIVVASYRSAATLPAHLAALAAQTLADAEIVVVDSSPDDESARAVAASGVPVRLVRSPRRLLPQEARNCGAAEARGELLLFTDPDTYPAADWCGRMVAAHRQTGHAVVGALECWGGRWLDRGVHLTKFSKFLPGGPPRPVDTAPTAAFLCPRALFESCGGFPADAFQGDALFAWRLLERGETLWFEPRAVTDHDHRTGLGDFLRERFRRGVGFGHLRAAARHHRRRDDLGFLLVSLLPLRLARVLSLVAGHAVRARWGLRLLATLPLVAAGHAANLLGESRAYAERLLAGAAAAPPATSREAAPAAPQASAPATASHGGAAAGASHQAAASASTGGSSLPPPRKPASPPQPRAAQASAPTSASSASATAAAAPSPPNGGTSTSSPATRSAVATARARTTVDSRPAASSRRSG